MGETILFSIIGIIIWYAILSAVISGATKSKDRLKIEVAQLKLTIYIAAKSGVNPEDIKQACKEITYLTGHDIFKQEILINNQAQ